MALWLWEAFFQPLHTLGVVSDPQYPHSMGSWSLLGPRTHFPWPPGATPRVWQPLQKVIFVDLHSKNGPKWGNSVFFSIQGVNITSGRQQTTQEHIPQLWDTPGSGL